MRIEYHCHECGNKVIEEVDPMLKVFEVKVYRCNCCVAGREQHFLMSAKIIHE